VQQSRVGPSCERKKDEKQRKESGQLIRITSSGDPQRDVFVEGKRRWELTSDPQQERFLPLGALFKEMRFVLGYPRRPFGVRCQARLEFGEVDGVDGHDRRS
jgi:hypothetical protein